MTPDRGSALPTFDRSADEAARVRTSLAMAARGPMWPCVLWIGTRDRLLWPNCPLVRMLDKEYHAAVTPSFDPERISRRSAPASAPDGDRMTPETTDRSRSASMVATTIRNASATCGRRPSPPPRPLARASRRQPARYRALGSGPRQGASTSAMVACPDELAARGGIADAAPRRGVPTAYREAFGRGPFSGRPVTETPRQRVPALHRVDGPEQRHVAAMCGGAHTGGRGVRSLISNPSGEEED